ncbi:tetratricopeptide repeat protein [Shimia sp.]|uniref:tetratricopeptide repeat protein n=1 Tax=Shimia sp. TaxID=1954381 RepID=UPI003296A1A2
MIRAYLAHGVRTPTHLEAVLNAEPDFAMAHAARGLFCMMMARRELVVAAHEAYAKARTALEQGGSTERERLWVEALSDWISGKPSASIQRMEQALLLNPADTFSMKVSQAIRFMLGDNHGMRRSVDRVINAHGADHPLRGYAYGCHSFALEETGSYAEAEKAGLDGLMWAHDDAWGLHAVAHVYTMTQRPLDGLSLIDNNMSAWDQSNNFRYHVWWHKALLHLDRGEFDIVLSLYDTKIREDKTDDFRDFSNASSLLVRLELAGIDVGDRWVELADLAESRGDDGHLTFADLHYMLALTGDKREDAAARMIARIKQSGQGTSEAANVMEHPGVTAAMGLAAFSEGQYQTAFDQLHAGIDAFQTLGGSHAQRDVFVQVTIDAAMRAGHFDAAERLILDRRNVRKGTVDSFAKSRLANISHHQTVKHTTAA